MTNTQALRNLTLGDAERLYIQGSISQDQWEGFTHAWATSAPRFSSYPGWVEHEFATPGAEAVARELGCCGVRMRASRPAYGIGSV